MSAERRVRIALADDQALVLHGLSALLADFGDLQIVVEAHDGAALLGALATRRVDVVVTDLRMPGLDGIELVRALRARGDATPVILVTTFDDHDALLAAVDAGAQGFLLKDAAPADLHAAIRRVAAGDTLLQPVSLGAVRARWQEPRTPVSNVRLTEREISILRLIAGGYSNKEIGRSLHLTEGTVKNYISDLLVKLDCRDRTHAVLTAIIQRLL
jgi:DNA-binding NarL/FixJ family response regulator